VTQSVFKSHRAIKIAAAVLRVGLVINIKDLSCGYAQLSSGPYEILPYQDGFIDEAFKDLQPNSGAIADWTGWSGSTWVSPDAYDNHIGTDVSVQTGTQLYASAPGMVTEVVNSYARDDHTTYCGNYIRIAVDAMTPNPDIS